MKQIEVPSPAAPRSPRRLHVLRPQRADDIVPRCHLPPRQLGPASHPVIALSSFACRNCSACQEYPPKESQSTRNFAALEEVASRWLENTLEFPGLDRFQENVEGIPMHHMHQKSQEAVGRDHSRTPTSRRRASRFGTQKIVRFGTRERYRFGTRVRASRLEAIATTSLHCLVANCNPPHPPPPTPPPHPTRSLVCTAEVCFERPSKRVCVCVKMLTLSNLATLSALQSRTVWLLTATHPTPSPPPHPILHP